MEKIIKSFSTSISAPERFIEAQHGLAVKFKESTKDLYDISRNNRLEQIDSALPELIVQNFDDEQIWQELELQSGPSMQELVDVVSKLSATQTLSFETVDKSKKASPQLTENDGSEDDEEAEENDDADDDGDDSDIDENEDLGEFKGFDNAIDSDASDEERELEALLQKAQAIPQDEDEDEADDDEEDQTDDDVDFDFETGKKSSSKEAEASKASSKKKKMKSVVDDKFFALSDMAEFLEQEDAREERRLRRQERGGHAEESSEDEDMDLDEEDEDESGTDVKYSEFFDPPNGEMAEKKKKVSFSVEDAESDEDEESGDEGEASEKEDEAEEEMKGAVAGVNRDLFEDSDEGEELSDIFGGVRSGFEKRQDRLKKKIKDMEDSTMAAKPWQLKGEITAAGRPENSLLQEDLDFDSNARAAPVITEETTKSLEDIVKQRIKDKAWDDVERKEKKTEDVFEFKKKVVLDQEKSKQSLSQVYEEEYIKQQEEDQEDKDDPKHEAIAKSMQSLFTKLDALSNYHFTPKPAAPDIKIISNLPSIAMEEALPVAASEATTLAPEEVKEKRKEELKGDTEKSQTDKKRDRRKKKQRQGAYYEMKETKAKKLATLNPKSKIAKKKAAGDVTKLAKTTSNVSLMKEKDQGSLTSSSHFFSQLQDQVSTQIAAKKAHKVSKELDKNKKSSSKLKL